MADVLVNLGQTENAYIYDDAAVYSDASPVVGVKAARIQATSAPTVAVDVLRSDDISSMVASSGLVLTAGVGLSGGGDLTANRTFALDVNELGIETGIAAGDFLVMEDITDNGSQKITFANLEAAINHDSLTGFIANEHIDWTAASSTNLNCLAAEIDGDLNHDGSNVGFFGTTPTTKQTALTSQNTSITHTAPGTPDFAIQDLIDSGVGSAFGFATKDEGNTVLQVILNLQTRLAEVETKLQNYGLLV